MGRKAWLLTTLDRQSSCLGRANGSFAWSQTLRPSSSGCPPPTSSLPTSTSPGWISQGAPCRKRSVTVGRKESTRKTYKGTASHTTSIPRGWSTPVSSIQSVVSVQICRAPIGSPSILSASTSRQVSAMASRSACTESSRKPSTTSSNTALPRVQAYGLKRTAARSC